MNIVHRSRVGTYHPAPGADVAWTVSDTRGYLDIGPSCDECGACECDDCQCEEACHGARQKRCACDCMLHHEANYDDECIGLSFAFVCLDGGDALCEDCAAASGISIVPCDCP